MKLWGKVARGLLLVIAAVFAAVSYAVPADPRESAIIVAILLFAALFGVPAIVRLFMSFTGDEDVLQNGTHGVATIISLKPTRWRYNRYYPIVRFGLTVNCGAVYPVEIRQAIDPNLLAQLVPGVVVSVRVDQLNRKNVVIDWREPIRSAI